MKEIERQNMNTSQDELEQKLQGKTLQVYLYLKKRKEPSGIREIQRDLKLSTPSLVLYHIDKLTSLGLVFRDNYGRLLVARKIRIKEPDSYIVFRFVVPRFALYASLFSVVSALYAILSGHSFNIHVLMITVSSAAIFWFETLKKWRCNVEQSVNRENKGLRHYHFNSQLIFGLTTLTIVMILLFLYFVITGGNVVQSPSQYCLNEHQICYKM